MADNRPVGIVGAGLIGGGWTLHFLRLGYDVAAHDPADGAEARLREMVARDWPLMERLGLTSGASPDRLTFAASLEEAVADAAIVQECAPERLEIKQALFAEMDRLAPPETLLFTSTSSFPVGQVRARTARPERCLLGHPFNPPHILPLVEVAGGPRDAPEILRAMAFWQSVEKVPVHLRKELPGHLVNRLTAALFREAVHLIAEDVADVADIDTAIANGPGLRLALAGPFLNYHLGGGEGGIEHYLRHLGPSQVARWESLGEPELSDEVAARIVDGVKAETAGRTIAELAAERDEGLLRLLEIAKPD
jgi:3-hydroxyacyl-CoA dehydrogenase